MQADYSVEIGGDAAALEVPWRSEDGTLRFRDLRAQPELLLEIEEASRFRELAEFLAVVNAAHSPLASAKCDVWATRELTEEEAVFGAPLKLASYVDLFFTGDVRTEFDTHEEFARALCGLLAKAPEIPSAAEVTIRRCYFHASDGDADGYCMTFYVSGYGDDEADARQRWAIGLKLAQNAIMQLAGRSVQR